MVVPVDGQSFSPPQSGLDRCAGRGRKSVNFDGGWLVMKKATRKALGEQDRGARVSKTARGGAPGAHDFFAATESISASTLWATAL